MDPGWILQLRRKQNILVLFIKVQEACCKRKEQWGKKASIDVIENHANIFSVMDMQETLSRTAVSQI